MRKGHDVVIPRDGSVGKLPRMASTLAVAVVVTNCGGNVVPGEARPGGTPPPTPAATTGPVLTPSDAPPAAYPACTTEPNPGLCNRAVGDVLGIASFGEQSPSDVLMESNCSVRGCEGTLSLFAPNGFSIVARLTSKGPNEPWAIESIVRDPGGPVAIPSPSGT